MTKVVSPTGEPIDASPEPNPNVVELAKDILRMAESGELIGFAGVGATDDDGTYMFRAGYQTVPLVGRLEHLKHKIVSEWDE